MVPSRRLSRDAPQSERNRYEDVRGGGRRKGSVSAMSLVERLARMHGQVAPLQDVTYKRAGIRSRAWDWLREAARRTVRRIGVAPLVVYGVAFAFYLAAGLILIAQLGITGDEPWYLMLGYSLVHNHTANLAAIVHNPALYHTFTSHADDHTGDYLGAGERVLPNLPGYALILGIATALAGRAGIVIVQAAATALTATLLFTEGQRLFASRAAGVFAAAAFALALPATVYVAQMFPSALASSAAFAGFVLATRALPAARGRRLLLAALGRRLLPAALGVGALCALLPWLHFKYALVALALLGLALLRLGFVRVSRRGIRFSADMEARRAAAIIVGGAALSFLLIALYCHHYFGAWTPQYSTAAGSGMDFAHPNLPRAVALYTDMFASNQSGLLPWVPLDFLVIPGVALLWRRSPAQARAVLALIGAQLVGFLPVLFTTAIYQGYALPSRFTVECAPFFALCVAAVFAAGFPALRADCASLLALARQLVASSPHTSKDAPGVGARLVSPVRMTADSSKAHPRRSGAESLASLRATRIRQHAIALACALALILILAGGWPLAVALSSPGLLYASTAGNRLAEKDAALVPTWWFAAFPDPGHVVTYSQTVMLAVDTSTAATQDNSATLTASAQLPPGEYTATFTWNCALTPGASTSQPLSLTVVRVVPGHPILAQRTEPASACDGASHTDSVPTFGSDGYDAIRFTVAALPGVSVTQARVRYVVVAPR